MMRFDYEMNNTKAQRHKGTEGIAGPGDFQADTSMAM